MKYRTIYRETTIEWMKLRIKSMIWKIRKQKNTQSEEQEEKEIQKSEDSLRDNIKHSNSHMTEMTKGKRERKKLKTYFKK